MSLLMNSAHLIIQHEGRDRQQLSVLTQGACSSRGAGERPRTPKRPAEQGVLNWENQGCPGNPTLGPSEL